MIKYKLVPAEPTDEMVIRGAEDVFDSLRQLGVEICDDTCKATETEQKIAESCFNAMLAAALVVEGQADHAHLRERFDEIEREIMEGKHTASSVFTQMRTATLYSAPQPAPDVAALVEALEDIAGTHHHSASAGVYFANRARKALAAYRKQEPEQ